MLPKKIVISLPNWLGDIVLSLPTIKGMRWLFPESRLAVLVRANFAALFKYNPDVDEVIAYQRGGGVRKFLSGWKMARTMREKHFDLALILPRSFNSALLTFLSKIPQRIGYAADARSLLLTQTIHRSKHLLEQHRVYYFLNLLNHFGRHIPVSAPQIHTGREEARWVTNTRHELNLPVKHYLVGFNAGAAYGAAKCWFPERYAQLAHKLVEQFNAHILLFGSGLEAAVNARIVRDGPKGRVWDLSGRTDVLQLAAVLKSCHFLVTNDTGPMHLAAAVGTPVVAIFGPTDPVTTAPFGHNHILVRQAVPCSPCLERTCPRHDQYCLDLVTVSAVLDACRNITGR